MHTEEFAANEWKGHIKGATYSVQGNILGPGHGSCLRERPLGELAERLLFKASNNAAVSSKRPSHRFWSFAREQVEPEQSAVLRQRQQQPRPIARTEAAGAAATGVEPSGKRRSSRHDFAQAIRPRR